MATLVNSITSRAASFVSGDKAAASIADAVQIGLDPGTSDFSIAFFVQGTTGTLINKGTISAGDGGYRIALSVNKLVVQFRGVTGAVIAVTGTTLLNTSMHSVVVTFDRDGNATAYIDGVLEMTLDISAYVAESLNSTRAFTIGAYSSTEVPASAVISHPRFWSRLLTADEIARQCNVVGSTPYARPYEQLTTAERVGLQGCWDDPPTEIDASNQWLDKTANANHLSFAAANIIDATTLNGGFETWTTTTDAATWTESVSGSSTVNQESVAPYAGAYACRFDVDGSNSNVFVYQSVLTANRKYAASIYGKSASGTPTMNVGGTAGGYRYTPTLSTSYTAYPGTFTANNTIFALERNSAASNSIFLDNITLASAAIPSVSGPLIVDSPTRTIAECVRTTSQVKTLHATTTLRVQDTTGYVSTAWSGDGATEHEGCLVYIHTPGTMTLTVALQRDISGVWTDVASTYLDSAGSTSKSQSWYNFKYTAAHVEVSGTNNYRVKAYRSAGSSYSDLRADNADATKIAIVCALTKTATYSSTDNLILCAVTQASSTYPTSVTVSMNLNDSSTTYGSITTATGLTLAWENTAGSTYYLKLDGAANVNVSPTYVIWVQNGSYFTVSGDVATSTTLDLAASAERLIQVDAGGTFTVTGNRITDWRDTLATTVNATGTSFTTTVNHSASWQANDWITLSCTEARNQTEAVQIDSVVGTTVNLKTGVTYTHRSGAEVCNLTHKTIIKRTGASDARITSAGTVVVDGVQVGTIIAGVAGQGLTTSTTNTGGISTLASTVNHSLSYSSFIACGGASTTRYAIYEAYNTITGIQDIIVYAPLGQGPLFFCRTATNAVYSNITVCKITGAYYGIQINSGSIFEISDLHVYDDNNVASSYGVVFSTGSCLFLYRPKIWGFYVNVITNAAHVCICKIYNGYIGSDGTNSVSSVYDFSAGSANTSRCYLYNTITTNAPAARSYGNSMWLSPYNGIFSQNHNGVPGRFRSSVVNGIISDQITGGQAADWAYNGNLCVYLDPNSITSGNTLDWDFSVPVTASVPFTVAFYARTTQAVSGPTMTYTIYDSHDDFTVLAGPTSVDVTNASWAQKTLATVTPTDTGFCKIRLKVQQGAVSGDIGIDNIWLL